MTRPYVAKDEMGEMIFDYLSENDATIGEACDDLGITRSQFYYGIEYVKDVLASGNTSPVTYDPSTQRYSLALQPDEAERYQRYRLRIARKQLTRLYTGTAEPAAKLFGSVMARRFALHLAQAQEELGLLLDELGEQPAVSSNGHAPEITP